MASKQKRLLCIMDPLEKLKLPIDSTYHLLVEFKKRGWEIHWADVADVWFDQHDLKVKTRELIPNEDYNYEFKENYEGLVNLFDLVLIRKEPPFDMQYVYLTYLLDLVANEVPVLNHPTGIRNANEKLSSIPYSKWMPPTCVSTSVEQLYDFYQKLGDDIVVKPLDEKGGNGILKITKDDIHAKELLHQATRSEHHFVMAQAFLPRTSRKGEKRVFVLGSDILVTADKCPTGEEFRANLGLGGIYERSDLTKQEEALVREIIPFLVKEKLVFCGLDILHEKLLEINVTCTGGMVETQEIYQDLKPLQAVVSYLEDYQLPVLTD